MSKVIYVNNEEQTVVEQYNGVELVSTTIIGTPKSDLGVVPSELKELEVTTESGEIVYVGVDNKWNVKYIPPILTKELEYVMYLGEKDYNYYGGIPLERIKTIKDLFWHYNWNANRISTPVGALKEIINFKDPIMDLANVYKYEYEIIKEKIENHPKYDDYMEENLYRNFAILKDSWWGDNHTYSTIKIINKDGYENECAPYLGVQTICSGGSAANYYYGDLVPSQESIKVMKQITKELNGDME